MQTTRGQRFIVVSVVLSLLILGSAFAHGQVNLFRQAAAEKLWQENVDREKKASEKATKEAESRSERSSEKGGGTGQGGCPCSLDVNCCPTPNKMK